MSLIASEAVCWIRFALKRKSVVVVDHTRWLPLPKKKDSIEPVNSDCIHAYHRTTDRSTLLVVIFELGSKYGGHAWYFQPKLLANLLYLYGALSVIQHPKVSEAFLNMKASAVPDGSDANKQLVTSLHPEGYDPPTKSSLAYRHYNMHTIITLPVCELGSKKRGDLDRSYHQQNC